jgi:hypothetical protein
MPALTLFPETTIAPEFGGMGVVGAATAHAALSDASDSSYLNIQMTTSEPHKWFRGELQSLPAGAGVITSVVIKVRADNDGFADNHTELRSGDYPNNRLTDQLVHGVITNFQTGVIVDLDVAEVNAAMWMAGAAYTNGASPVNTRIYEMSFDVDFNYLNGVSLAMIFEILGPLVAVGLHELPLLRWELYRRGRLWLHRHELDQVWRDLRAARHPRHFLLGA